MVSVLLPAFVHQEMLVERSSTCDSFDAVGLTSPTAVTPRRLDFGSPAVVTWHCNNVASDHVWYPCFSTRLYIFARIIHRSLQHHRAPTGSAVTRISQRNRRTKLQPCKNRPKWTRAKLNQQYHNSHGSFFTTGKKWQLKCLINLNSLGGVVISGWTCCARRDIQPNTLIHHWSNYKERKRQYSAMRRAIFKEATPELIAKFSLSSDKERLLT